VQDLSSLRREASSRVKKGELTDEAWARIEPLLPGYGRRGIRHTILKRRDQRECRAGRHGAPRFDHDIYRKRNVAERYVNR
jgi:hypothetical protein